MSSAVTVRGAGGGDAPALSAFLTNLVAERLPVIFRRNHVPNVDEARTFIEGFENSPWSLLLVADAGGVLAGMLAGMLDFRGDQRVQRAHVGAFGMSVARDWRRRGVGSRLLQRLLSWAGPQGIRRIELEVMSNNDPAIQLYLKAGFVVEGTKAGAVEIDGDYVDLIQMAMLL